MTTMHASPSFSIAPSVRARVAPALLRALSRRLRRAARRLHIPPEELAVLGVRITDDEEMSALHLRYMGEQGPTDVLSFTGDGPGDLGDLVLDWQAIERQAAAPTDAARLDEATVLMVHGLAHLTGHDHRDRVEGRRMHLDERRVLRSLGVASPPRPYAPRLLRREP